MTSADLDTVLAIEQTVQAYPWTRGNFSDALHHGYLCSVVEDKGLILGYTILMPVMDEAELLSIAVTANQQRRGTGRMMMEALLQTARNGYMRRVFLEVRPSNTAAIALYCSVGFVEIGVRQGYYQNVSGSEDALMMACELMGVSCRATS